MTPPLKPLAPRFNQRHYEMIATLLSNLHPEQHASFPAAALLHHEKIEDALAAMFAADNDRFDTEKFYRRAEPNRLEVS